MTSSDLRALQVPFPGVPISSPDAIQASPTVRWPQAKESTQEITGIELLALWQFGRSMILHKPSSPEGLSRGPEWGKPTLVRFWLASQTLLENRLRKVFHGRGLEGGDAHLCDAERR